MSTSLWGGGQREACPTAPRPRTGEPPLGRTRNPQNHKRGGGKGILSMPMPRACLTAVQSEWDSSRALSTTTRLLGAEYPMGRDFKKFKKVRNSKPARYSVADSSRACPPIVWAAASLIAGDVQHRLAVGQHQQAAGQRRAEAAWVGSRRFEENHAFSKMQLPNCPNLSVRKGSIIFYVVRQ